jgi:hypothetical protein
MRHFIEKAKGRKEGLNKPTIQLSIITYKSDATPRVKIGNSQRVCKFKPNIVKARIFGITHID